MTSEPIPLRRIAPDRASGSPTRDVSLTPHPPRYLHRSGSGRWPGETRVGAMRRELSPEGVAVGFLLVVREIRDGARTGCPAYDAVTHRQAADALCAAP